MSKSLVIAAAGTGGHVMPGIAVARLMMARGWNVYWLGTETGMERRIVEKHGIPFTALDFEGLRGKGVKTMLFGGFKLLNCIYKSKKYLTEHKADVVFSTGGYIAVPVCLGAGLDSIPYVLMNSDADPLLSIRMIQGNSSGIMCGFDGNAAKLAGKRGIVTGNPVRKEILAIPDPEMRYAQEKGRMNLLIFGGSLGAQVFNQTAPKAISLIPEDKRPNVVHQCGIKAVAEVQESYRQFGVKAEVVPFIEDMASAYEKADIVLARAGAISVSEMMVAGIPSILVPLVVKTTSHQRGNAVFMAEKGAAIHLPQSELTPEKLAETIGTLDREKLLEMAKNAKKLGKPNAATTVADFLEHITRKE